MKIIGVGGVGIVNQTGDGLRTYGLGSCIALLVIDQQAKVAGMVHVALPDSQLNPAKAKTTPGYFADTAVPHLFNEMAKLGSRVGISKAGISIKLVGGSQSLDNKNVYRIGERNIRTIKKLLNSYGLSVDAEDVGGCNISRSLEFSVDTGHAALWSGSRKNKKII